MWAVGRDHHLNKNQSIARKVEMEAEWAATKVSTTTKTDSLIRWPYPCILCITTFGLWVLCLVWQREGEVMGRITSWGHGTSTRVTNWPGFPGMEWFPGMQDLRYQHWGNHKQTERLVTWWPHQMQHWSASNELMNLGIHGYMPQKVNHCVPLMNTHPIPLLKCFFFFLARNLNLNIKKSVDIIS